METPAISFGTGLLLAISGTFLLSRETQAGNILFFNGRGEGSHYFTAAAIAEELSTQGHSVTFLLGENYMYRAQHPKHSKLFSFIPCKFLQVEEFEAHMHNFSQIAMEGRNIFFEFEQLQKGLDIEVGYCENVFHSYFLKTLLDHKFDMIVFDPSWSCAVALSQYIQVKKVILSPISVWPSLLRTVGNPLNPATVGETGFGFPVRMNFIQRVQNVLAVGFFHLMLSQFVDGPFQHIFAPLGIKPYLSSLSDVDLTIISSDPLVDKTFAKMPGVVVADGLTACPSQHLPEDLENFMQSSGEHGVILFSLGSYLTHLPEKFVILFQEAFSKLPQKVIWQWKGTAPATNMPENVKTMSWLPQNDLLGHNKTRLLIYQGGNNGFYEAIYHAVPLLVMPVMLDNLDIAENTVAKGIGRKINLKDLTTKDVLEAISDILSDETYQYNVNHMSEIFRDQPLPPRKRAAFWIEHVMKYGSDHLRSPNHDFNFFQLNLIDVFSFLIVCLVSLLALLSYAIKLGIRITKKNLFAKKEKTA